MKKGMILLLLAMSMGAFAKISYIPHCYTHISLEDNGVTTKDSTIFNELIVSTIDNRFTLVVAHDSLTQERIKAIKKAKAAYGLSVAAAVLGGITSSLSAMQTPLTQIDAKWQAMNYTKGMGTMVSSSYWAYVNKAKTNTLQKLAINIIFINNTDKEMCINDMARGLIWYIRPYGTLTLSVGNPEINSFRIAYANQLEPCVSYAIIQGANNLEEVVLTYEDDEYWIYEYTPKHQASAMPTFYVICDKKTMSKKLVKYEEGNQYIKERKQITGQN